MRVNHTGHTPFCKEGRDLVTCVTAVFCTTLSVCLCVCVCGGGIHFSQPLLFETLSFSLPLFLLSLPLFLPSLPPSLPFSSPSFSYSSPPFLPPLRVSSHLWRMRLKKLSRNKKRYMQVYHIPVLQCVLTPDDQPHSQAITTTISWSQTLHPL